MLCLQPFREHLKEMCVLHICDVSVLSAVYVNQPNYYRPVSGVRGTFHIVAGRSRHRTTDTERERERERDPAR